jgi:hypothetical protein
MSRKKGPLFWILIVVGVLVVLGAVSSHPALVTGNVVASLPGWIEAYPGTTPQGTMSAKSDEGSSVTYSFKTGDGPQRVLDFYEDQVQRAGLEVSSKSTTIGGGMLLAEDRSTKRQVVVTMSASGDGVMSVTEGN